ncbi:MAG TPA: hypothetical protein DCE42_27760, partial [Myxococcales bacterium]|nr:hypothetical protein [Myxococcales bacterium]
MLIEEWDASHTSKSYVEFPSSSHSPLAIVGIGVQNGHARDLDSFRTTMWRGDSLLDWRPSTRWRGFESSDLVDGMPSMGAYFEPYDMTVGEFRIPPHEIPQIMSQQLVMLQVAAEALRDAGMPLRERRPEMGTCIGINFDFETTDFHLRWALYDLGPSLYEASHSELPYDEWFVTVQDALSRPLNATSTVGSLGGIVGSRVAKEFLLGGPSFVVSAEEASGLRALEVAARALQQGEVDAALVGAVDLTGDIRQLLQRHVEGAYTSSSKCLPFDVRADGTLPGDAAVALVLKRYDDALADQDHIYSVFRGVGFASGSDQASFVPNVQACEAAIHRAHKDASVERFDIGLIEANGSGIIEEDLHEAYTLTKMYADEEHPIAVSTSKKATGHTGAAAGLLSVVHASLCLSDTLLPASHNAPDCLLNEPFHTPKWPQHWLRDQVDGSRHAAVHCLTSDGNAAHVLLEQPLQPSAQPPEGQTKWGLFPVAFSDAQEAATQTQRLKDFLLQATEPFEMVSRRWCEAFSPSEEDLIYCVVTSDRDHLLSVLKEVASLCEAGDMDGLSDISGVYFAPRPHAKDGQVAFVYPGSGNHYFGMGRELGLRWPQILHELDAETERLRTQLVTDKTTPWRADWPSSWRKEAKEELLSDPHNTIFSQVVHGGFVTRVMRGFGLEPDAMIGYSLGESAGLFALEVWQDRCEMLNRILASPIFRKELGLEYRA